MEIKSQIEDPIFLSQLVKKLKGLIKEKYDKENVDISEEHIENVLFWSTSRITKIEDLVSKFGFLWILPKSTDFDKKLLGDVVENLDALDDFSQDKIKECLRDFAMKNNMKFAKLMRVLRSVLSGLSEGPGVAEMMHLLGKHQTIERIKAVIK